MMDYVDTMYAHDFRPASPGFVFTVPGLPRLPVIGWGTDDGWRTIWPVVIASNGRPQRVDEVENRDWRIEAA